MRDFDYVIHAATAVRADLISQNPLDMLDTITLGTRHVLDMAVQCNVKRVLLTSSGAVYGRQPCDISAMGEDYLGALDVADPLSVYGHGKRIAELLCRIYKQQYGIEIVIARCFAFVGPYLDLGIHFAIGNFIRDGLRGDPIKVSGDGTAVRSYLYAADLAIWLWTLLLKATSGQVYNVSGLMQGIAFAILLTKWRVAWITP